MRPSGRLALALTGALVFAGCITAQDEPSALEATDDPAEGHHNANLVPLNLSGTNCLEGGGHSVHPKMFNPLPDPWTPADVLEDVGEQYVYSEIPDPLAPKPEEGNTMGNYHATVWCESWVLDGEEKKDLILGFVGMKTEAPRFAPEEEHAPTHNYLITVIATNDEDVFARLNAAGFHAFKATAALDLGLPDDWIRIQMWTGKEQNGDYDSLFKPKLLGDNHAPHVRLWFQHHNDDGTYTPVALDMFSKGGEHYGAEAQGYFSHTENDHHRPLPGAHGHTAALMYKGFDRTFDWGPRPDVRLDGAYHH